MIWNPLSADHPSCVGFVSTKIWFYLTTDVRLYFVLYQAEGLHINSKEPAKSQFQCITCNMTNQSLIRSTIHVRYLYLLSSSWSWLRASSLWVSGSTGSWVSGQLVGLVAKWLQLMLKPLSFTFQRVLVRHNPIASADACCHADNGPQSSTNHFSQHQPEKNWTCVTVSTQSTVFDNGKLHCPP